jgi:hypothetical protein
MENVPAKNSAGNSTFKVRFSIEDNISLSVLFGRLWARKRLDRPAHAVRDPCCAFFEHIEASVPFPPRVRNVQFPQRGIDDLGVPAAVGGGRIFTE